MFNAKNTKKQGDIGLGAAIGYFTAQGHTVSIPLTDSQDYDLIVERNDGLKKVQAKTTRHKNKYGIYVVGLKMAGGNSKKNYIHKTCDELEYDLLFVLTEDDGAYVIPKDRLGSGQINLGKGYKQYKVTESDLR